MNIIKGQVYQSFVYDGNALIIDDTALILDDSKETIDALSDALYYIRRGRKANKPENYAEFVRVLADIIVEMCPEVNNGPSRISLTDAKKWARERELQPCVVCGKLLAVGVRDVPVVCDENCGRKFLQEQGIE